MFRVKICGITSPADATMSIDAGADAIGINFFRESSRFVGLDEASAISAAVAGHARVVGVFVDASRTTLEKTISWVGLQAVQLHGHESPSDLMDLSVPVIKAFRLGEVSPRQVLEYVQAANRLRRTCHAVLVDAHRPGLPGGTGALADWSAACQLATILEEVPLILAGGLTASNVADAIRTVAPYGVDVASGVESEPGRKSPLLVHAFAKAAWDAFRNG